MGRVHKKKLAEYAEAGENENDLEKSGSKSKSNSDSESENGDDVLPTDKSKDVSKDSVDGEGEDDEKDDDYKSLDGDDAGEGDDSEDEALSKKTKKRKALEKSKENTANDEEEELNGGSAPKKGRKSAGAGAKGKAAAKNGKAAAGRGKAKGKKPQKTADDDDDEDADEGEEEYEVKEIIDQKTERGAVYFLIRWKGYTKADDTWEPEDTLSCPDLIEKFRKKATESKAQKKGSAKKNGRGSARGRVATERGDPNKEWEVDRIIDYAEEKTGRIFRIRWKGFGPKHDTWEPEKNLSCDEIIDKFLKRMKTQENITFKELREEPKKTKRLVNETAPRTTYTNRIGRTTSRRSAAKKRVYYGDSDD